MQKKTSINVPDSDEARFKAAKALVYHLHKIGQIKEVPTDEKIEEVWSKLQEEKGKEEINPNNNE